MKNIITLKKAQELWKSFDYSIYWLNVLIDNYIISKADAGFLIINESKGIK